MAPSSSIVAYFGLGLSVGLIIALTFTTYSSLKLTMPKLVYHASYDPELSLDVDKTRILNTDDHISLPNQRTNDRKNSNQTQQTVYWHEGLDKQKGPEEEFHFKDGHAHHDDSTVAEELYRKIRVLCWVMTSPENLEKKAIHVRATWGKRCNKLLFMSSVTNSSFPTIGLNISEGREHLTAKTMRAYDHVADNYMDEADWFMKADDDTYVILENLRYFLSDVDPNEPVFYGHLFKTIVSQGYFSGGGGYVLSKEALKRFRGRQQKQCREDGGSEDVAIGKCMETLGVKTGTSLDAFGRSRFHCFSPDVHLSGGFPDWYYSFDAYGAKSGLGSVSDYAITFHYISPEKMYHLEFYVYHLRPYGLISKTQSLNVPSNRTS
ncbi:glycoprotein-N-acetylgalactosamine 3-beta-galactosyltransferase 1-like [Liolophura sinensis]|uniref:glycoprotein-N-acetylgalactosamine 3-beta-galactosyltransferase 1-like n=1 Tax=Liolophura sinensis TaxID=3198878 RepID=UPI00315878F0